MLPEFLGICPGIRTHCFEVIKKSGKPIFSHLFTSFHIFSHRFYKSRGLILLRQGRESYSPQTWRSYAGVLRDLDLMLNPLAMSSRIFQPLGLHRKRARALCRETLEEVGRFQASERSYTVILCNLGCRGAVLT